MSYMEGILEVTSQVRAVPLGQKRKRGRPKALGNCLLKSPPLTRAPLCDDSQSADTQPSPASLLTQASSPYPGRPPAQPVFAPAMRKSKQMKKVLTPVSPRKTRRTVVSTLARKSPVKRKAVSPVKDVPIARKLRPRK